MFCNIHAGNLTWDDGTKACFTAMQGTAPNSLEYPPPIFFRYYYAATRIPPYAWEDKVDQSWGFMCKTLGELL